MVSKTSASPAPVIDIDELPDSTLLDTPQTSRVIRTQPTTMAVWRCTGRYDLPWVKIGRKVFYRVGDIRAYLQRRTRGGCQGGGQQ